MIDIELLRKNPDLFRDSLKKRNLDTAVVDQFLTIDKEWRAKLSEIETMRAQQKKLGAERKIEEAKALKEKLGVLEQGLPELEEKRMKLVRHIPNLLLEGVPVGKLDPAHRSAVPAGLRADAKPAARRRARSRSLGQPADRRCIPPAPSTPPWRSR